MGDEVGCLRVLGLGGSDLRGVGEGVWFLASHF